MISGLAVLKVENGNEIAEYIDDELYDTEDEFDEYVSSMSADYAVYFFSDDEDHDGAMKTGNQKVKIDGDTFTFKFKKAGSDKGIGIKGEDDDKYYLSGKLLTADGDNKIEIINIKEGSADYLKKVAVSDFVKSNGIKKAAPKTSKAKDGDTYYEINNAKDFAVVNTAGTVIKSGTKKDGDGFKVVVKNKKIEYIYVD